MSFSIMANRKLTTVDILVTSNSSVNIVGNTSTSHIAIGDEYVIGASIIKMTCGSPSGGNSYWAVKRGSNTVAILDTTTFIDFSNNGASLSKDSAAKLVFELVGSADGYVLVTLRKILTDPASIPEIVIGPPSGDALVVSQSYAEIIASQSGPMHMTQNYIEILTKMSGNARVSQNYIEVIRTEA